MGRLKRSFRLLNKLCRSKLANPSKPKIRISENVTAELSFVNRPMRSRGTTAAVNRTDRNGQQMAAMPTKLPTTTAPAVIGDSSPPRSGSSGPAPIPRAIASFFLCRRKTSRSGVGLFMGTRRAIPGDTSDETRLRPRKASPRSHRLCSIVGQSVRRNHNANAGFARFLPGQGVRSRLFYFDKFVRSNGYLDADWPAKRGCADHATRPLPGEQGLRRHLFRWPVRQLRLGKVLEFNQQPIYHRRGVRPCL